MSDWDGSDDGKTSKKPALPVPIKAKKWEGEEEGKEQVESDWDKSSGDESKPATTTTGPPQKKKGTLKAKLAEKETSRKTKLENGQLDDADYIDLRDKYMDEKEMRRILREKELESDLMNANDLFGQTSISERPSKSATTASAGKTTNTNVNIPAHLAPFVTLPPPSRIASKPEFDQLSKVIYNNLLKPASTTASPQYASFVEQHAKLLCSNLKESEIKKVVNALNGLASQKAAEARAKAGASGKKNLKGLSGAGMMAGEGGGKGRFDTTAYDEALDDFDDDEFM